MNEWWVETRRCEVGDRDDFDGAHGGDPVKAFFLSVSCRKEDALLIIQGRGEWMVCWRAELQGDEC